MSFFFPSLLTTLAGCRKPAEGFIPVVFHRVEKNDGTGSLTRMQIERQIQALSSLFAGFGYEFYLHDIRDIQDEEAFVNQLTDEKKAEALIEKSGRVDGAINVLVTDLPDAYYEFPAYPIIEKESSPLSPTLAHSIGHYLGLGHTPNQPGNIMHPGFSCSTNCLTLFSFTPGQLEEMRRLKTISRLEVHDQPKPLVANADLLSVGCGHEENHDRLNRALEDVSLAGTVELCDGTYGSVKISEGEVTIRGKQGHQAILDGRNSQTVVTMAYDILPPTEPSVLNLENLVITRGSADNGGGIYAIGPLKLTLDRVTVSDNVASNKGGGLYLDDSIFVDDMIEAVVTASRFQGNRAEAGGAIFTVPVGDNSLQIVDSTFQNNMAEENGGALSADGAEISGSYFFGNQAASGGAIYLSGAISSIISKTEIMGNLALQGGGITFWVTRGSLTVTESRLSGNSASLGGGLYGNCSRDGLFLSGVALEDNEASNTGGGIYLDGDGGEVLIDENTFSFNRAGQDGGAIHFSSCQVQIGQTTINNNAAGNRGGGLSSYDSFFSLTNSTVTGNGAGNGGGGIVSFYGNGEINSTTVYDNVATDLFGGEDIDTHGSNMTFVHTITGGSTDGLWRCFYSLSTVTANNHNLGSDQSCFDTESGSTDLTGVFLDFFPLDDNGGATTTLLPKPGNPAIDGGLSDGACPTETDQRGVNRPAGSACDIGAVEILTGR